jgi:hypothetical protein
MRTYIITFTIFGKTFKSKVKADTYTEAKTELIKSILRKITFDSWEVEKSDPSVDALKSFFGMK